MICPECQHDIAEHTLYGCYEGEAVLREDEIATLREKARLWDVLGAALLSGAWEVLLGIDGRVVIALLPARSSVTAPTLTEAVKMAMEAEGER